MTLKSQNSRVESRPLNFKNSCIASLRQRIAYSIFFRPLLIFSLKCFKIFIFEYKTFNFTIIIAHNLAQKYVKLLKSRTVALRCDLLAIQPWKIQSLRSHPTLLSNRAESLRSLDKPDMINRKLVFSFSKILRIKKDGQSSDT